MRRNSALLLILLLAGCDRMSSANRSEQSEDVTVSTVAPVDENVSEPVEGVGAPMAWRVVEGAAFYGAAGQPPAFALRCDRANGQIIFERAGGGTALNLSVGDVGASLGTREVSGGRAQARTGMGDAVLDRMARPQSQIIVGGGPLTLTIPGGVAIRRVVDFCRNPPAPPTLPPDNMVAPANAVVPVPVLPTPTPTPEGF